MTGKPSAKNDNTRLGILFGGTAALIWGAWPVITTLGVDANLTPYQLVLLRVLVSAPILLPWVLRGKNTLRDWAKALVLSVLAGVPYSFIASSGFQYSSATHAGVIIPGTIMLTGLFTSHIFLRDRLNRHRLIGAFSIMIGLLLLAAGATNSDGSNASLIGDLMFFTAGILWSGYTLMLRIWPMDPVVITARVAFLSLIWIGLAQPFAPNFDFSNVPTKMLVLQILWQGIVSSVFAIISFNKGVAILGAARASVLNALIPAVSTVLAFVVLSEVPTGLEQAGLLAILLGIATAMFLKPGKGKGPGSVPRNDPAPAPQKG